MVSTRSKTGWLWVLHTVLTTGHSLNDMMPIFFGGSLGSPHGNGVVPPIVGWSMFVAYSLPAAIVMLMTLTDSKVVRVMSLLSAVLTVLINQWHWLNHVVLEFAMVPANVALTLTILQINAYVLLYLCWKWLREDALATNQA